ncbi:MAG: hypothetical protein M1826_004499 [Phylliscum demangeonii]|nr:MAG: hypothetical protein M1826_004499 [Phylliscum demangeonii]
MRTFSWPKNNQPDSPSGTHTTGERSPPRQLEDDEAEREIAERNKVLDTLAAVFPDIQVEVFREMLLKFTGDSQLKLVTEALLQARAAWVKGRWRTTEDELTRRGDPANPQDEVPKNERFRTNTYKLAVKQACYREFLHLPRSTVNAVLAEHNYSYVLARPTLLQLASSRTWWSTLSALLRRRTPPDCALTDHPLLLWQVEDPQDNTTWVPSVRPTKSLELSQELFETLVKPFQEARREEQETKDHALALLLNESQAKLYRALHDCECCFTDTTFEQLTACNRGGHFICLSCVRHAVHEALYGQGWARNVDCQMGTLRCIAPSMGDGAVCPGAIGIEFVHRAFMDEKGGGDIPRKFEERLAADALTRSSLSLACCPFCVYAEDADVQWLARRWRYRRDKALFLEPRPVVIACAALLPLVLHFALVVAIALHLVLRSAAGSAVLVNSLARISRRRRGLRFVCQSPRCGRASCLSCGKEWRDIHICYESEQVALRTFVERAMAEAVKRTCPHCQLSFVKSSGCNRLTCVCGYRMCYVCRSAIGPEGYRHFCEHFRPRGEARCTECDKCDLYQCEDEQVAVRRAAEGAVAQWSAEHARPNAARGWGHPMPRLQTTAILDFNRREINPRGRQPWTDVWRRMATKRTWLNLMDGVVEELIEVPA